MTIKESEYSIDYEFIKKYVRESSDDEDNLKKENQEHLLDHFKTKKSGSTEVFNKIGEGESYSENRSFDNRQNKKDEFESSNEKIESTLSPVTEAKREFLEYLEDESLSIDTCSHITHD